MPDATGNKIGDTPLCVGVIVSKIVILLLSLVVWFPGDNEPNQVVFWDPDSSEMSLGQSYPRLDLSGEDREDHASAKYSEDAILIAGGLDKPLTIA